MNEKYKHHGHEEKLEEENNFLKMKIMLEHGGQFCSGKASEEQLPAEIENEFLNNIIEFEQKFATHNTITVFEKIGKPHCFEPADGIPDVRMEQAWENLSQYMSEHGVELFACSPKVTARELYRFTTEELFKYETDNISIPGIISGFIYDEFYPDHEYDNGRTAIDDCIRPLLRKERFDRMHSFSDEIRLNDHFPLKKDDFKNMINWFKDIYDEIELDDVQIDSSQIQDKSCVVKGNYSAHIKFENVTAECKGAWLIEFALDEDLDYWYMNNVRIEGIGF